MNIYGKKVNLRAIEIEDQEFLRKMINDPEMEKLVVGYSFPVSKDQQLIWYKDNYNDSRNLRLIIESKNNELIGYANLINIDLKNRSASHGLKIFDNNLRNKGYGTDSLMAIMKYAFEELQLNRIESTIIEYNEPSKKLYTKKCGWTVEGIKRQSSFKQNKYHNELIIAILKDDYLSLVNKTGYWNET
jgi:RimJ/RimL family protein N-acetyltransferase